MRVGVGLAASEGGAGQGDGTLATGPMPGIGFKAGRARWAGGTSIKLGGAEAVAQGWGQEARPVRTWVALGPAVDNSAQLQGPQE